MLKHQLAALGVALALLALLDPAAAAGLKFGKEDLKSEKSLWKLYGRWGARYNVTRDPAEKLRRFNIFKDTARRVHHRAAADQAPGLNVFADLSNEEFTRDYTCRMSTAVDDDRRNVTAPPVKRRQGNGTLPLPVSVNWRTRSCSGRPCLGQIQNQGTCGSCWAFAATAAMESHYAIRGANNHDPEAQLSLSNQELVDCDTKSNGCKGGLATNAFNYVLKSGLSSSADYPYTAKNGTCNAATTPRVDFIMRGYQTVPAQDEFQLLQAVGYGPVVVAIAVEDNNMEFQDYDGGMYGGPCSPQAYHAMLLVGYGRDYYILKISFGDDWGDDGFMFLRRERGESCGVLRRGGSYPEMGL